MTEWESVRIGEALSVAHGFAFRGEFFREEGDLIVLTPGNFHEAGGFKQKSGKEKYYAESFPNEFLLAKSQVVVAMTEQSKGLLGSTATIPDDNKYLHNQRIGLLRIEDPSRLDLRFAYHLLNAPYVRQQIQATATGSKVRHTAPTRIESVVVLLPNIRFQRQIAYALDSLEDSIENNRRRIEILEEMARLLYREWFVHFRFPGHEDVELVDSDIGSIPEGWEALPASGVLRINPRLHVEKERETQFITMNDLRPSSMVCRASERKSGNSGAKFQNDDTLFARITPCLENGKTGFVQCLSDGEVGRGSTEFIVLRAHRLSPECTYLLAREHGFREHAIKSMSGSSGRQRVRVECFDSYLLAVPPGTLVERFSSVVSPMFQLVAKLADQNHVLLEARNLLLPRLVSGELDVADLDLGLVAV